MVCESCVTSVEVEVIEYIKNVSQKESTEQNVN